MADITRKQQPAPRVYGVLETGHAFVVDYEDQAGIPVDQSNEDPRKYSPFVIRVIPPSILGSQIASGGVDDPYSQEFLNVSGGEFEVYTAPAGYAYGEISSIVDGSSIRTLGTPEFETLESLTPFDFIREFDQNEPEEHLDAGTAFGAHRHDEHGHRQHNGIDVYLEAGEPVYAPFSGTVTSVYNTRSTSDLGRALTLVSDQNPELVIRIMHMRETDNFVSGDTHVNEGDQIGFVYTSDAPGNKFPGGSTPHLHIEARVDGEVHENGNFNAYAAFDVSRIGFRGGFETPPAGDGEVQVITVDSDSTQVSQLGIYSNANDSLRQSDTLASFEDQIRSGIQQSITTGTLQRLQTIVNGSGELTTPNTHGRANPAITTERVTADVLLQIINMSRVPPLQFLVNPDQFQLQFNKLQQFTERTRTGYVFQAWGDEQPTLTISGQFGAYISATGLRLGLQDPTTGTTAASAGAQFASKRDSAAFQQLTNLLMLYKNSGYIFDTLANSEAFHMIGNLAIDYDGWTYLGHFESFSWGYTDEKVSGGMEFNGSFKVSRMIEYASNTTTIEPYFNPGSPRSTSTGDTPGSPLSNGGTNEPQNFVSPLSPVTPPTPFAAIPPPLFPPPVVSAEEVDSALGRVVALLDEDTGTFADELPAPTEGFDFTEDEGFDFTEEEASSFDTDRPYGEHDPNHVGHNH